MCPSILYAFSSQMSKIIRPSPSVLQRILLSAFVVVLMAGLATVGQQSGNVSLWVEREVAIAYEGITLHGVLTLPPSGGPHPALVLITGAAGPEGRGGVSEWAHVTHAHRLALQGFACLRYDPPGVGRSEGERGFDTVESRAAEALVVAESLRCQPEVEPEHVGLWGVSQGGWVIAMAAAQAPEMIAFLVMASGTTVSVAEQQVYGVEVQSLAAGVAGEDLVKAVLVSRLLIDWQVPSPIFQARNENDVASLGDGPWADFAEVVYGPVPLPPEEELERVIGILESIDVEPWAGSLYLGELYIPNLRSIPVTEFQAILEGAADSLLANPREYFELITCPILALFGEDDLHLPVERSVELLEEYLAAAENNDLTVVIFLDAGHSLNNFMAAYWEELYAWLEVLESSWDNEGS